MTSIRFSSSGDSLQQGSEQRNGDSQYYSAAFDTSASFTMNPLSSHPPRTPRTCHSAAESGYEDKEGGGGCEEGTETGEGERRVREEDVWREMFLTSYGRDKAFVGCLFVFRADDTEGVCVWMVESDSVFYSRVSTVPWTCWYEQTKDGEGADVDGVGSVYDKVGCCCQNGMGC